MTSTVDTPVCERHGCEKRLYSQGCKHGYKSWRCPECRSETRKARYAENRTREIGLAVAWQEAHPAQVQAARQRRVIVRNPEVVERYTRKRRALKAGVVSEPISRIDVAIRDNWTCQLCGDPVDPTLTEFQSGYGSVDHKTPLSKGGTDTMDNAQLAHVGCNSRKKDNLHMSAMHLRAVRRGPTGGI